MAPYKLVWSMLLALFLGLVQPKGSNGWISSSSRTREQRHNILKKEESDIGVHRAEKKRKDAIKLLIEFMKDYKGDEKTIKSSDFSYKQRKENEKPKRRVKKIELFKHFKSTKNNNISPKNESLKMTHYRNDEKTELQSKNIRVRVKKIEPNRKKNEKDLIKVHVRVKKIEPTLKHTNSKYLTTTSSYMQVERFQKSTDQPSSIYLTDPTNIRNRNNQTHSYYSTESSKTNRQNIHQSSSSFFTYSSDRKTDNSQNFQSRKTLKTTESTTKVKNEHSTDPTKNGPIREKKTELPRKNFHITQHSTYLKGKTENSRIKINRNTKTKTTKSPETSIPQTSTSLVPETIDLPVNIKPVIYLESNPGTTENNDNQQTKDLNDIENLQMSLYGFCSGRKMKQTFTASGCENITVETLVCGGVCQAPIQTFHNIKDIERAFETCKYCGPLEYEEKLIFMQCHKGTEKRRRWKIEVRKMYVPKTCGCIQESCYKMNKVSADKNWGL